MAYIGKQPVVGNFQVCHAITVVNGQAAYTMQVSSANVEPENANHMLVSLNGILQKPGSSFTISGSTITFASNLATGDVIDFIILLGNVLDIGAPSDGTVTNAKLASDVISGETDIGGAIADADLFLMDDGAGGTLRKTAASRIKTYVGGGITEADMWRLSADLSGDGDPISSNLERVDDGTFEKIGTGLSESSGIFTFASTGLYLITFFCSMQMDANGDGSMTYTIQGTPDNSTYDDLAEGVFSGDTSNNQNQSGSVSTFFNCTNVSTHKVKFKVASMNSNNTKGSSSETKTGMQFIRLGDSQ